MTLSADDISMIVTAVTNANQSMCDDLKAFIRQEIAQKTMVDQRPTLPSDKYPNPFLNGDK